MQLTKGFEQAACIIALLATQKRDIPLSSQMIHERIKGSQTYLQKIMRKLVVAGLITSVSGNSGGFSLAKDPKEITLLQIVNATEGNIKTYPELGFLDLVFKDFLPISHEATHVIDEIFQEADKRWCEYLSEKTVYDIIIETFDNRQFKLVDWNDPDVTKNQELGDLLKDIKY
ncbi:Rrf2 family transcriptional regulator [Liquorilactobacillus mali]|uniref:Rrf2 family transcriptional regulator n=2 Tax=Liquorilactobacillus mali TaxID=1618 RepID=J0KZ42_9LACO|nr:Rrf2 family transcriptional regulator [Liquorilactobacillus mali]EJE99718.1 Rrf2 family transcriptional regulator [Liquorilactobacillus mali KCTC 3596 = DSM 20444]KRN09140.1 Rrf2 family transcriptional regulator [Liquorilactobacillus mali KCTC 3596 = DSM 20444]KRN29957.1 Rrf2 family transcriptional regulator [Liquorilactobacillus mali]MDC7953430.1 Rrf2 family transcriptional regulator [Liquorilactobacillus mali]MDN7144748.1 Rrf2 family transcriptional regulator [Liquorilactobacillus mali]